MYVQIRMVTVGTIQIQKQLVQTLVFLHLKWQQIIKMIQESVQCDIILGAMGLLVPQLMMKALV